MSKLLIPNTTQTPNVIIDHLMSYLGDAEFKCLMYIVRRTYGFQKSVDRISLSQFTDGIQRDGKVYDRGTGMTKPAVVEALKKLVELELVIRTGGGQEKFYEFNTNVEIGQVVKNFNQLKNLTGTSKKSLPVLVKKFNTQNQEETKRNKEYVKTPVLTGEIQRNPKKEKSKIAPDTPLDWNSYLKGMDDDKRDHIQLIAYYFKRRKLRFDTYGEVHEAIARHTKAATRVAKFEKEKVFAAMDRCDRMQGIRWTLDTVYKELTK